MPDNEKHVGLFRRIFTPTFQKIDSYVSIRSLVRDLTKLHIGVGLRTISGAQKAVIFAKPGRLLFDIVKPL